MADTLEPKIRLLFLNPPASANNPLRFFPHPSTTERKSALVTNKFTDMAVRPHCCPCGSPVYTQWEASPEWLFTQANCTRTITRYPSTTNMSRTPICRPSLPHAFSIHRLHFTDSDSEYITSMPTHHPLRPSQFYQKKPKKKTQAAHNGPPSKAPLAERNLNAGYNNKRGTKACKHGLAIANYLLAT